MLPSLSLPPLECCFGTSPIQAEKSRPDRNTFGSAMLATSATCRWSDGKADRKIVPPRLRIPYWKGLGAESEEKHEPASDIDTGVVDSLKALDLKRPIREADIPTSMQRFAHLCATRGRPGQHTL